MYFDISFELIYYFLLLFKFYFGIVCVSVWISDAAVLKPQYYCIPTHHSTISLRKWKKILWFRISSQKGYDTMAKRKKKTLTQHSAILSQSFNLYMCGQLRKADVNHLSASQPLKHLWFCFLFLPFSSEWTWTDEHCSQTFGCLVM